MTKRKYQSLLGEGIAQPGANDILSGRGDTINRHQGNVQFRRLVEKQRRVYLISQFKREKRMIAESIVSSVHDLDPPGRFLSKNAKTGLWHVMPHDRTLEKTAQALRENSKRVKEELEQEMKQNRAKAQPDSAYSKQRHHEHTRGAPPPNSYVTHPPVAGWGVPVYYTYGPVPPHPYPTTLVAIPAYGHHMPPPPHAWPVPGQAPPPPDAAHPVHSLYPPPLHKQSRPDYPVEEEDSSEDESFYDHRSPDLVQGPYKPVSRSNSLLLPPALIRKRAISMDESSRLGRAPSMDDSTQHHRAMSIDDAGRKDTTGFPLLPSVSYSPDLARRQVEPRTGREHSFAPPIPQEPASFQFPFAVSADQKIYKGMSPNREWSQVDAEQRDPPGYPQESPMSSPQRWRMSTNANGHDDLGKIFHSPSRFHLNSPRHVGLPPHAERSPATANCLAALDRMMDSNDDLGAALSPFSPREVAGGSDEDHLQYEYSPYCATGMQGGNS